MKNDRQDEELDVNVKRYEAIDGLHALSAIGILLMHVKVNGGYQINGFFYSTMVPSFTNLVFLFMVISSFSMCCGYYDKVVYNKISFVEFYNRRFAKIWPFFCIMCLLDFVVSPSVSSLYETFANLTLCFGLLPVTKFLGTISMEIYRSHMLIYRVIEKVGFSNIFDSHVLSFWVVSIMTIIGSCVFALIIKKAITIIQRKYLCLYKSHKSRWV